MNRTKTIALLSILACSCAAIRAYDEGTPAVPPPTVAPSAAAKVAPSPPPKIATPAPKRPSTAAPVKPAAATLVKAATTPKREVLLRLHGSNTIGSELGPRLAEAFLKVQGATNVRFHDADRANHRIWVLGDLGARPVGIEIYAPGSKVAFQSLAAGRCDIGMASRAAESFEAAPAEHVVALDGVAVIVHKNNPLTRLTLREVADIFAGTITNWAQLGGAPMKIQVYARDEKSGTFDTFKQVVLRGRAMQWQGVGAYEGSAALADAVAGDERGIGFIGLPYVRNARALALQDGEALPLYPTVFTVSTEDYPLSRRLRFYTAAQPKNPLVQQFVEFAMSDEGQRLVADNGFISLTVHAQAFQAPREAPEKYVRATHGGQRLSVNFRFKKGSAELDGKARKDVENVVRFLGGSDAYRTRRTMLFGFADRSGKETVNRALSKQRADAVAAELKEHGVVLEKVEGFGSAMPLSSGDSDEARERNRRVEVWVR